uniref:Integrase catalytic domain-containing protein n=1 Tax=Ananas comosus var. bracteatus TaxID=296719 RepID=A0A6V7P9A7_ANACO|nr:unnamed protein product [Ananas comosus var. bracteatus]
MVEKESGYQIKTLRTDRGGEFISNEFEAFCEAHGIFRQLTTSYTPQQNGVAERKNRTLVEMAKSMLKAKRLPNKFWAEAVSTATHILNRSPISSLEVLLRMKPGPKESRSDWAGSIDDRRSTSGFAFKLGSTCQAIWLRRILCDLHLKQLDPTIIYCDNQSTIAMAKNPVHHSRTKHIEIRHHFIRDQVANGNIQMVRVISCALSFSRISGRSLTVFRPMARVPRSVVRSLAPKSKNLDFGQLSDWLSGGLVPVQGCACTGTGAENSQTRASGLHFRRPSGLYRYSAVEPRTRASDLDFRSSCTGTRDPVYRYKEADFVQFVLQGLICDCGTLITAPTPHRASLVLEPEEEHAISTFLKLGAWVWSLIEGRYLKFENFELILRLLREPSTQGEARDRGKGVASS